MAGKARASASIVRTEITELRKKWGWSPSDIVNLMRGGGSSSKGSSYERAMCRRLSLWWTDNDRDDIFWRSSGSGGRAKVRGRAGLQTAGQHGDVSATDPIGAPLIDLITIEIKRGYSDYTFQDILDRPVGGGVQEWERWFAQAMESNTQAGSYAWMLITRRDRRAPLVWFPHYLFRSLSAAGAFPGRRRDPFLRSIVTVRDEAKEPHHIDTVAMNLDYFIAGVTPAHIKAVAKVA